ncbi:hypothetical protein SEA_DATBOI_42 [Gordonia phage DatBoi]|nr:hypothetical protein SEA_DATBOI_42 [Gordonia phage DatBoi]
MSLNYMVNGQMVEHAPKLLDPNTGQYVDPEQIAIWDGTKFVKIWPSYQEAIHLFTTVGTTNLTVPSWARFVDVVLIGGGGGGGGHAANSLNTGKGGDASSWQTTTLERGVHFTGSTLDIVVGAGGEGSNTNGGDGFSGGTTFVFAGANQLFSSTGGNGGAGNTSGASTPGGSPGDIVAFGVTHLGGVGGQGSWADAAAGTSPGAGGGGRGGGLINGRREGMPGARGQAWVRFRSN